MVCLQFLRFFFFYPRKSRYNCRVMDVSPVVFLLPLYNTSMFVPNNFCTWLYLKLNLWLNLVLESLQPQYVNMRYCIIQKYANIRVFRNHYLCLVQVKYWHLPKAQPKPLKQQQLKCIWTTLTIFYILRYMGNANIIIN